MSYCVNKYLLQNRLMIFELESASDFIMTCNVRRFLISLIKTVLKLFVKSSKIPAKEIK